MEYLEREAGAVAGVLPVHEELVDLLHQLHARHLPKQNKHLKVWWPLFFTFYFIFFSYTIHYRTWYSTGRFTSHNLA
jgi:hypothetical protein